MSRIGFLIATALLGLLVGCATVNTKVLGETQLPIFSASPYRNFSIRSMPRIYDEELCGDESYTGVCLNATECEARGGAGNDSCWNNDVCCKIIAKCPPNSNPCVIRNSGTTVVNETETAEYRRTYRYVKNENNCQLRLDFDELELAQPNSNGDCNNDSMQIITPEIGLAICGSNSQQHVYLNFNSRPYIDINMRIRNASKYRIRSTFIECNSENRAPENCLQYFTDLDGQVKSFNFGHQHLTNLEYSVCVEAYEGVKGIQWKACPGLGDMFFLSGSFHVSSLSSPDCGKDWVQIYGKDRYCGKGFPSIFSSAKPFLMNVRMDECDGNNVKLPVDPEPCDGIYYDSCTGGSFACTSGLSNECTCTFEPPAIDFDFIKDMDLNNIGFCLEYTQQW